MNTCSLGIQETVEKIINKKPWFNYNKAEDIVYVLESPNGNINKKTSIGVASKLADYINNKLNDGYKKIGKIAYADFIDGWGVVKIAPTKNQLFLINAKHQEDIIELEEEIKKELQEKEFENLKKEANEDLIDPFYQTNNIISSKASEKTLAAVKDFLKRIGVDVNLVKQITVNGQKLDVNGVAYIMKNLIEVIEGKEQESLPEEAMHFLVEIVQQTNPKLFNQLLKEINNYDLLKVVQKEYGPIYKTKDGKPDVIKIKKEAIAKVLVETIIKKNEGSTEKPELLAKTQSWFDKIIEMIKNLFVKSGFDKLAMDVLAGKEFTNETSSQEVFYQVNNAASFFEAIKNSGKNLEKNPIINGKQVEGYYLNGVEIPRVSYLTQDWYKRRNEAHELTKTEYQKALDDLRAERGTGGHADFEYIFSRFVDENGYLRETPLDDDGYVSQLNPKDGNRMYNTLKKNIEDRLSTFPEGTRFLSEVVVYSKKRNRAGTIDLIAITPDNKINILDWKFMTLNTEKYSDIPWYKVKSWNIQMDEYKEILSDILNVNHLSFGQTRMIPIRVRYTGGNQKEGKLPTLTDMEIGAVDPTQIEEDYLLPVGLENETTGNERLDSLIEKLNSVYKKLSDEKALPNEKAEKAEQLNALYKAIRHLQIKGQIKPLLEQAALLNKKIQSIIDEYDDRFKDADANAFSDEEVSNFTYRLETGIEALETYKHLDLELHDIVNLLSEEETKEYKEEIQKVTFNSRMFADSLEKRDEEFTNNIIGKRANVENLSNAEKTVKGLSRIFGTTATIQMKAMQALYKIAGKALSFASFEADNQNQILKDIQTRYMNWAQSKGISTKNLFDIIKEKDSNKLISQYKKEFYKELKDKIAEKDIAWIRDNIDEDAYKDYLKELKQKEKERIKNKIRVGTEDQIAKDIVKELKAIEELYNTSTHPYSGFLVYDDVKKFPKAHWESNEWKILNQKGNEVAKEFYNYIVDRNNHYYSIGYISAKEARTFLPWVRKGLAEKFIFGGKIALGESFLKQISLDESDTGYGKIDPLTGLPVNSIPTYFTSKVEDYSEDLFKTMALYNIYATKFEELSKIEAQARALIRLERNYKKSIATNIFGRSKIENGKIKTINDNSKNTELLESMVKAIVYQQRFVNNDSFDIVLGSLGNTGRKINEKLGMKIFPENLSDRQISLNKTVDQLNRLFQLNALGFNALSSLSNYFGGTSQSLINAGIYFTKKEHLSTQAWVLQNRMENGNVREKALASIEYFLPFTEGFDRDLLKKLSAVKFNEQAFNDFLMVLMRQGEKAVQVVNFYSFLRNAIVVDGEIKNVREYLRTLPEFKDIAINPKKEEAFEKAKEQLLKEKGLLNVSEIKDGKLVIPNIERKSDTVVEFRRKVQQFTSDALGSMTEDNKRMINLNVYGSSFMVFKNWIPRLVDVRFGEIKYNAASDAYEWGRTRTIVKIVASDILGSIGNITSIYKGNEKGIELIRNMYEQKKEQYEKDTNKEFKMTEEEFALLVRQNMKNQITDLVFYLNLFLLVAAAGQLGDDDDDEFTKNRNKFIVKATDKFKDEIGYFYDPTSILSLTSTGIFPAVGMIENYKKVFTNFIKENYGLIVENDKLVEDNKVIKYFMRSFPGSNQVASLLPMFYPELAKELGIRMTSQYGIK